MKIDILDAIIPTLGLLIVVPAAMWHVTTREVEAAPQGCHRQESPEVGITIDICHFGRKSCVVATNIVDGIAVDCWE